MMNYRNVILHSNYLYACIHISVHTFICNLSLPPFVSHMYSLAYPLTISKWNFFFNFEEASIQISMKCDDLLIIRANHHLILFLTFFLDNSLYLISVILNQAWCHSVWSIYKVRIYAFCASMSQSRQLSPVRRDIVRLSLIGVVIFRLYLPK